jgi:predicted metal-binding membrane protein
MADAAALESVLRRDRLFVAGGLSLVVALAAAWLLTGAGMDMRGGVMAAMRPMAWSPGYALVVLAMWWVMMVAMMLPSAAPMILLFAAVNRRTEERGGPYVPTAAFMLGYLLVWGAFSVLATALQWALDRAALLSPMMAASSVVLGGAILIGAGLYQLTPLKHACLRHCRSPFGFVMSHWRPGARGAVHMGVVHGGFCLGCCWVLMGLLFYGGVMSPVWIIGITVYVLIEKTVPFGDRLGAVAGLALVAWGGLVIAAA